MEDRFLFRGKRIDNGEWAHGNLIRSNDADIVGAVRKCIDERKEDEK